jgi:hypothetical protein
MSKMCNNISTVTMETLDAFKSTSFIKMVIAALVQHHQHTYCKIHKEAISSTIFCPEPPNLVVNSPWP